MKETEQNVKQLDRHSIHNNLQNWNLTLYQLTYRRECALTQLYNAPFLIKLKKEREGRGAPAVSCDGDEGENIIQLYVTYRQCMDASAPLSS
jgi:hypothetical protein